MSAVQCFRCHAEKWHATGRFNTSRHGVRRAELVCDACGYRFSSGYPAAIEAAAAERGECEITPETPAVVVPQPTLPVEGAHVRRDQGFVSPRGWAQRLAEDFKFKQAGDREEP